MFVLSVIDVIVKIRRVDDSVRSFIHSFIPCQVSGQDLDDSVDDVDDLD